MTLSPSISLLCIGDELLDGRTRDLNAAHIGLAIRQRGLAIRSSTFVPDDMEAITHALDLLMADTAPRLILITGGLGPTDDDLTRDAVARWTQRPLLRDAQALARLEARFAARAASPSPNNLKQADLPQGATPLYSDVGTAPGFAIVHHDTLIACWPGVPREVDWFIAHHLDALLLAAKLPAERLARRSLTLFGAGESAMETQLGDALRERAAHHHVQLAWRAESPLIHLTLIAPLEQNAALTELTQQAEAALLPHVIARDEQEPFARLGELLAARQLTVTCAESCTGGMLAAAITDIAGSSAWFQRGFVTYANEAKEELVGVTPEALTRFGAVSPQVAAQMAEGALQAARADLAIAITGVAGPGGGSPEKPVGTVHFALATPEGTWHHHATFTGRDRAQVRASSVYTALALLLWKLTDAQAPLALDGPHSRDTVWRPGGIAPAHP